MRPIETNSWKHKCGGGWFNKSILMPDPITVTEKVGDGQTRRYVYDGEDIFLEYDQASALLARYTHGPGIDEPIAMMRGGSTFFYHQDGLGTVTELTDATGTTAKSYAYDAWGNQIETTGTVENPYAYTGREFDAETGLYYYRARYYDSIAGRFIGEDSLHKPIPPLTLGLRRKFNSTVWLFPGMLRMPLLVGTLRLNQYGYVRDNPVTFGDPSGFIDDKRPCGREIDQCIAETRNSPLGGCLGTAYGLYFAGDGSSCTGGKFTRACLRRDQSQVIENCRGLGPFPKSCLEGVGKCIDQDPSLDKGDKCSGS